jgi:pimeloyl-ACP methyl ester carboxylesterase
MSPVDYVVCTRSVRQNAFTPEPGATRFLRIPPSASIASPKHMAVNDADVDAWFSEVRGLADGDENPYSVSPTGDVLVFIHGYNNDLDIILKRQRRLAADLRAEGWRGVVIGFDWPSADSTLNYLEDRADAAAVAEAMVRDCIARLAVGQEQGCQTNLHLIGHSTGAFVIMEAFSAAQKRGRLFRSPWRVGQVAFIGGDVSSASLSKTDQWAAPMYSRIMRLTNYSNPFDKVLGVSNAKRLGVAPRAGRVGLPEDAHPKAVDVDCGPYFATLDPGKCDFYGTFNHSWHIGNRVFARDLAMTLEGGIDRKAIPTRNFREGRLRLQDAPRPRHQKAWDEIS